jgi:hypothetical protein
VTVYIDKDYDDGSRNGETIESMPLYAIERVAGLDDAIPVEGELIRFRLFDDDGELMYEGRLHDDDECENQTAALRFGEADVGATRIEVCRDGEWKVEIG